MKPSISLLAHFKDSIGWFFINIWQQLEGVNSLYLSGLICTHWVNKFIEFESNNCQCTLI